MKYFQLTVLLAVTALLSFSTIITLHGKNDVFAQYPDIDGIKCDKTEHFNFHYHAHLSIFVNGSSYLVPGGIGIEPSDCIYWLHTHDDSGIIHIESPQNDTFNLGQFLKVWSIFDNSSFIKNISKDDIPANVSIMSENGSKINTDD